MVTKFTMTVTWKLTCFLNVYQYVWVLLVYQLLDKLNEERSHVSDVIRQEFADRIVATEEENRRIKTEMSELRVSAVRQLQ